MNDHLAFWFVFIFWDCSACQLVFFFFLNFFVFMEVVCWTVVLTEVREGCMRLKLHIVTQTLAKLITVYGSVKNGLLVISSWPVGTLNVKLVIFLTEIKACWIRRGCKIQITSL